MDDVYISATSSLFIKHLRIFKMFYRKIFLATDQTAEIIKVFVTNELCILYKDINNKCEIQYN